jgi:hypothetical protein
MFSFLHACWPVVSLCLCIMSLWVTVQAAFDVGLANQVTVSRQLN